MRAAIAAALLASLGAAPASAPFSRTLDVAAPGEAIATVRARCAGCDWGQNGREAATLRVTVDGTYSQHIVLVRGDEPADYRVTLGPLAAGRHRIVLTADPALSAHDAGAATVEAVDVAIIRPDEAGAAGADLYTAQSMAPILHARPNTIGRFTDVPLLMWYEAVPTPRGRQFRYSVVFSNEDGGTATDRLMATWGRTTDIEFVYGVEVDASGRVLTEEFQGPGHEVPPFKGRHVERHPLLYVSTDNNMVTEAGTAAVRYAPAPQPFVLTDTAREVVMDRSPWTYTIAALELSREGKIGDDAAAPRSGKIPDLRRFVHVEACIELENAAVAFSVRAADRTGTARWFDSDRGDPAFRIVRTGCFRGAVPLPASADHPEAVRFRAYRRQPKDAGPGPSSVRLTRVNAVFTLDDRFRPRPSMFSWTGSADLAIEGEWRELPFQR